MNADVCNVPWDILSKHNIPLNDDSVTSKDCFRFGVKLRGTETEFCSSRGINRSVCRKASWNLQNYELETDFFFKKYLSSLMEKAITSLVPSKILLQAHKHV